MAELSGGWWHSTTQPPGDYCSLLKVACRREGEEEREWGEKRRRGTLEERSGEDIP